MSVSVSHAHIRRTHMHIRLVGTNPNSRSNRATLLTCQMPHETGRDERQQAQSHQSTAAGLASFGGDDGDGGKNVARVTMIGVAAMYGTNFASVKILEEAMPPSVAAALRFTIASIVLLPLFRGASQKVVLPSIQIGLLTAGGYYAQGMSLASGGADASTSAFLCSLAVVVCPLLDLVQGTRKLGRSEAVAIALAVAGTGVLELTGSVPGTGDLWAMVQPLVFGTPFWKVEQLIHKFPTQANANRGKIQTARLCTSSPPKQMPVSPNGGPCIWMFPRFGKFPRFPRPQGRGILETQRHSRLQQSVSSLWPGHSTLAAVALAFRVLLLPPPQLVKCCRQTEDWCQRWFGPQFSPPR